MFYKKFLSIFLTLVILASCSSGTLDDSELGYIKDSRRQVCLISYKNNIIIHYNFSLKPYVSSMYYLKNDNVTLSTEKLYLKTKVLPNRIYTVNEYGSITYVKIKNQELERYIKSDLFQKNHLVENITIEQSIKKLMFEMQESLEK